MLHAMNVLGIEIDTKPRYKGKPIASKFVNLFNDFWVGSWFPPNCTSASRQL
jgi:hypothetical protein